MKLKKATKDIKYFGHLCTKNCCQELQKIVQSGHTGQVPSKLGHHLKKPINCLCPICRKIQLKSCFYVQGNVKIELTDSTVMVGRSSNGRFEGLWRYFDKKFQLLNITNIVNGNLTIFYLENISFITTGKSLFS